MARSRVAAPTEQPPAEPLTLAIQPDQESDLASTAETEPQPEAENGTEPELPKNRGGRPRGSKRTRPDVEDEPAPSPRPVEGEEPIGPPTFWEELSKMTLADWERHEAYVYVLEPHVKLDVGGRVARYLKKYSAPFNEDTLKSDNGSGVYQIRLNQRRDAPGTGTRTIRMVTIEICDPAFPPKLPRGDWMQDGRNARWAAMMPPADNTPAPAATAAATPASHAALSAQEFMAVVKDAIAIARPGESAQAQQSTTAAVIEAMRTSHSQAFEMYQQQNKGQDPAQLLATVIAIVERIAPKPDTSASDRLVTMLMDDRKMMQQQLADLQKMLMEQKAAPAADPLQSLQKAAEVVAAFHDIAGDQGKFDWRAVLANIATTVADKVAPAVPMMIANMNRPAAVPGATPNPAPAMPPQPAAAQPPTQPPTAAAGPTPTKEDQEMFAQFRAFAVQISGPMLGHLDGGSSGDIFADWLIQGYGMMVFEQIRQAGKPALLALFRSIPDVWQRLQPVQPQFERFIDEFLAWKPDEDAADEPGPIPTRSTLQ